jgi:hypothetical protein
MSIADWSGLASSVAVVATLVLLLLQMRQTNHNQKAIMQQSRTARINAQQHITLEPTLAAIMARTYRSDLTLDPSEVRMINAFIQAFFWNHEDGYLQRKAGFLEEEVWEGDLAVIRSALVSPAFRVGWKMTRTVCSAAYRDFIDAQMAEVQPRKAYEEAAIWKHLMEKELAQVAGR